MKSLGLLSQILTIGIAALIAAFYVQPTLVEIGEIQTDTAQYKSERQKISVVNQSLGANLALVEGVSPQNRQKMSTYMPPFVDDISVMRDIAFIMEEAGLEYSQLSYDGVLDGFNQSADETDAVSKLGDLAPTAHSFTLSFSGQYEQIKELLLLLEVNEYPLEVHSFSLSDDEEEGMTVNLLLVTYADDSVSLLTN